MYFDYICINHLAIILSLSGKGNNYGRGSAKKYDEQSFKVSDKVFLE